jgi:ankyrin repeat protein
MLAAMNGHTQAVKLLLDMGSDINAQVSTTPKNIITERLVKMQLSVCQCIIVILVLILSIYYLKLAFDGIVLSVSD